MAKRRRAASSEDQLANQSGGVDIDSQDTQVRGDVTGRDKIVNISINVQNPSPEALARLLNSDVPASEPKRPVPPPVAPSPDTSNAFAQPAAGFQPVGRWQVRVSDMAGSVIFIDLYPDGSCQGWQQAANLGISVPFVGQWAFSPYNQMLQLQGVTNGQYPFAFVVAIQSQLANGFYGIGTDGNGYYIERA